MPALIRWLALSLALASPTAAEALQLSNGAEVRHGPVLMRVTALTDHILRVRIARDGTLPEDASWAVPAAVRAKSVAVTPTADGFATKALKVAIAPDLSLTVTDPDGWWRAGTPQSLGCPGSAYLDVPAPPLGDHWVTARQAVQAWFTVLHRPGTLTADPAPIGYPDAPSQTWLVSEDGKPYVAMTVTDPGGGFVASADLLCAAS